MAALEEIEKLRAELKAQQDFQNELLIGAYKGIDYLAQIAVDHERRIKGLELPPR